MLLLEKWFWGGCYVELLKLDTICCTCSRGRRRNLRCWPDTGAVQATQVGGKRCCRREIHEKWTQAPERSRNMHCSGLGLITFVRLANKQYNTSRNHQDMSERVWLDCSSGSKASTMLTRATVSLQRDDTSWPFTWRDRIQALVSK